MRALLRPRLERVLRLLLVGALMLWLAHACERTWVRWMIPSLTAAVELLDADLAVLDMDVVSDGSRRTLQIRADLARPMVVGTRVLYPLGWNTKTAGWYQVSLTVGGVLQYALVFAIIVLAWPTQRATPWVKEILLRTVLAMPLMAVLLFVQVPFTIIVELRQPLEQELDPTAFSPWFIWSRFLMGGGGVALAILFAVLCIVLARTSQRNPAQMSIDPIRAALD